MSRNNGTGITWAELYKFLTTTAGCAEVSWTPGTHVWLRTPTGVEFETCKPEKPGDVSLIHFADIAKVFGKNRTQMMVWMGKRTLGKSKLTNKRTQSISPGKIPPPYLQRTRTVGREIQRAGIHIEQAAANPAITSDTIKQLEAAAAYLREAAKSIA